MRPATLEIRAGETVHFRNANATGLVCTVVADDGAFESPALGRQGGAQGDDAWVDIRGRGGLARSQARGEEARETNLRIFEAEQAAEGRIEVAQCEWHGTGEWPDVVDPGVPA